MKKVSRPQYARIRRILELIRQGPASGRLPNARDFCKDLGVSRPTVMRDLDWLRDEENAPIEYAPSRHGYRLNDDTWDLPATELSRQEIFALSIARKLLAALRGTPLAGDMESALGKIAETLECKMAFSPTALTDRFAVVSDDYVVEKGDRRSGLLKLVLIPLHQFEAVAIWIIEETDTEPGHNGGTVYDLVCLYSVGVKTGNGRVNIRNFERQMFEPDGLFPSGKRFGIITYGKQFQAR